LWSFLKSIVKLVEVFMCLVTLAFVRS